MLCYVMFDIGLIVNRSVENNTKSVTFAKNLFHVTNVEPNQFVKAMQLYSE